MSELTLYILYLSGWRFVVLFCGAMSIFLGYRLFVLGYSQDSTSIEGTYGGSSVVFRNFAPGTAFALFGATLIGVMVASSPAEVTLVPGRASVATASDKFTDPDAGVDVRASGGSLILRGE